MNDEKTEILALGNNSLQESDFPKHNFCEVIKILGIYFGYDVRQRDNLNFRETLKSIKKSVSLWKWRGLSLLGRIQIVKAFAIPKFMFRASVIPTSKELITEVNSILYSFIWNGKDKVKRHALISDIEMGGLKIRNNEFLCYDKKSMYRRDIVNLGFVKIGDLITENHSFSYGTNPKIFSHEYYQLNSCRMAFCCESLCGCVSEWPSSKYPNYKDGKWQFSTNFWCLF